MICVQFLRITHTDLKRKITGNVIENWSEWMSERDYVYSSIWKTQSKWSKEPREWDSSPSGVQSQGCFPVLEAVYSTLVLRCLFKCSGYSPEQPQQEVGWVFYLQFGRQGCWNYLKLQGRQSYDPQDQVLSFCCFIFLSQDVWIFSVWYLDPNVWKGQTLIWKNNWSNIRIYPWYRLFGNDTVINLYY